MALIKPTQSARPVANTGIRWETESGSCSSGNGLVSPQPQMLSWPLDRALSLQWAWKDHERLKQPLEMLLGVREVISKRQVLITTADHILPSGRSK